MTRINPTIRQPLTTSPRKGVAIKEDWHVAGKNYSSSEDLLNSGDRFDMNQAFYTRTEVRSKTLGERISGMAKKAVVGGALATGLNAALAIATGGASIGVVSAAVLLGGTLLGAASGATGQPTASAEGTLDTKDDKTYFYPENVASREIELTTVDNGPALFANQSGLLAHAAG